LEIRIFFRFPINLDIMLSILYYNFVVKSTSIIEKCY